MKNFTIKASLIAFAGVLSLTANAQQKPQGIKKFGRSVIETQPCGTVQYENLLLKKNPQRDNKNEFEQWIAPKVAQVKRKRLQKDGNTTNEVVTIPVVFHIIHNGSPVGTAENIADGQVISQIEVLNEDFRRMAGTNGFNTNPVGADMEINFCLAQQDPDGLLSTGIVRYELGTGQGWSMEEAEVIKAQTQWNPEKYLNIWVFDQLYGLAGYAQFPVNSGLDGIDDIDGLPSAANTDGVALGHLYVGSEEKFPEGEYDETRNLGRSASHEVGHFFGLRHIWGDSDSCETATDYCDDTPTALAANYGCQVGLDSCPGPGDDMIENYMDYSDDACLSVFTQDQKDRMQAVLLNSPRRHSLITSTGCVPGIVLENDGSLNINNSTGGECASSPYIPEVVLKNSGSVVLTAATIAYHVDNQAAATYNWTGSLAANASATITLPEFILASGTHTFNVSITTVNGTEDLAPNNDEKSSEFTISAKYITSGIKITIKTDDFGDETLWALVREGAEDDIIAGNININNISQSDFYDDNETYVTNVPISVNDCYAFIILDFGGDGMCCEFGEGSYKVETTAGVLIAQGGSFADQEQKFFALEAPTAGIDDHNKIDGIQLYPNPANSILNIASTEANMPESYTVYNSLGQVIDNGSVTSVLQSLDITKYANGVYFVKLTRNENATTLQFIKH